MVAYRVCFVPLMSLSLRIIVVSVASGTHTHKLSSCTTEVFTLTLLLKTLQRDAGPPDLESPSTPVSTVKRPRPTLHSICTTAHPCGRPVFWACTMVFSPAELDASMEEAFGPIIDTLQYKRQADPPTTGLSRESKSARGDGDPDKTKGAPKGQGWPKGRGRGKTTPTPQGAGGSRGGFGGSGGSQDRAEPPDSLTRVMARALIQQADAIAVLRQSTAWIFFLQTALPSVVPTLGKAAARWRAQVNDEGSEIFGLGLRVVLIWALFNVLRQTLEEPPAELLADARDRKWLNQTGAWVFLRWNRKTKALEPDASRAALNQSDMVKLLKEAGSLADGETVSRFAANRRLEEGMQGRVVPMQMDVQFRSPRAHQLYSTLEQLQGLSALNLLGVSFRKEGYRRPNGIQQLADWLG